MSFWQRPTPKKRKPPRQKPRQLQNPARRNPRPSLRPPRNLRPRRPQPKKPALKPARTLQRLPPMRWWPSLRLSCLRRRRPKPSPLRKLPKPKLWPASRSAPRASTPKTPSGFICRKSAASACYGRMRRSSWHEKSLISSTLRSSLRSSRATTAGSPTTKSGLPWWKCP